MHTPDLLADMMGTWLRLLGQGAAAMMALHPRSLSGLCRRASEVGCKVRGSFFPPCWYIYPISLLRALCDPHKADRAYARQT